jgi:hypothetical protein
MRVESVKNIKFKFEIIQMEEE